jgi:fructokinase
MHVLHRPVVFGEVLFDCFPDGSEVLGGAPFNVAWHLQGLGLNPIMVSRIGADRKGDLVLEAMRQWGLSVEGIQTDASRPTGVVDVSLKEGQPGFDIRAEQAYDHIDAKLACGVVADEPLALLYHGTLALRTPPSSEVVRALQETTGIRTFLDVNLREPWWTDAVVRGSIEAATWLKLNEDELAMVTRTTAKNGEARRHASRGLFEKHDALACIYVTRGAEGAESMTREGRYLDEAPGPVADLVDTVGAGDAFSAVTVMGLMRDWPSDVVLHRAVQFAAEICGIRGATTSDRDLYKRCLQTWEKEHGVV